MAKMKGIVCFGELLLRLNTPGNECLLQSPRLEVFIGGAEANVAVALSRLGHSTKMVSRLPDNSLGEAVRAELRKHAVDVSAVETANGRMGLYYLTTGKGLRRSEVVYDRADSAFSLCPPENYDWPSLLRGAAWLHLSGVTPAVGTKPAQACIDAITAARKLGLQVSFDGNYREQLWARRQHRGKEVLGDILRGATLAFVNERDLALMLGQSFDAGSGDENRRATMAAAFSACPSLERICFSQRRCDSASRFQYSALMYTRNRVYRSKAYQLDDIVDRVGTGDAFAAGVLHGLITRQGNQAALEFGTAAAALKHSIPGDFNLATAEQITHLTRDGSLDISR